MTIPAENSPRWLSLKEACRYGHIGRDRLITLIRSGDIIGFQDPDNGRRDYHELLWKEWEGKTPGERCQYYLNYLKSVAK